MQLNVEKLGRFAFSWNNRKKKDSKIDSKKVIYSNIVRYNVTRPMDKKC